jgi:hypothetical protein
MPTDPLFYPARRVRDVAVKAGQYFELKPDQVNWGRAEGEPEGVDEVVLHRHKDGSYTHVLRVRAGVEFAQPVKHAFYEEAFYLEGEMLNTKTKQTIGAGAYVFHKPGEPHGPFRCLKTCLILEFRYYKGSLGSATSEKRKHER